MCLLLLSRPFLRAAAAMAQMVTPGGTVTGIDYPDLIALARRNLAKSWAPLLNELVPTINLLAGDGWQGVPGALPYAAIHVGAAAAYIPPSLLAQLAPGGRMVIPVGPAGGDQVLHVVDKMLDGTIQEQATVAVQFVPLVPNARVPSC